MRETDPMTEHRPPPGKRRGWYTDPRGGPGQRWFDGDTWTVATRPDPASEPPDPYEGFEATPGQNGAAIAGFGFGFVSLMWNPLGLLGGIGLVLSLLGRRRVRTWVRERYRPTGARLATWGIVLSGVATTFTLLTQGALT